MTREERIAYFEALLDRGERAAAALETALADYGAARDGLRALEAYYTGPDWMADFAADEAGLLPASLKRGVLSEDAVYDLLARCQALDERLKA